MVPCAYYKPKSPGIFEAGLAFFVGPAPEDATIAGGSDNAVWDEKLGAGATHMILDMIESLGDPKAPPGREASGLGVGTTELRVIGLDLRPRMAIGPMAMPFVLQAQSIVVVKHPLLEDEPVWNDVVRAGFRKLPYASMVPAGFAGAPPADIEHT
jgi:hypothetical protein